MADELEVGDRVAVVDANAIQNSNLEQGDVGTVVRLGDNEWVGPTLVVHFDMLDMEIEMLADELWPLTMWQEVERMSREV